jgi:predicted nuclease of predicted toxin-antitoxin system
MPASKPVVRFVIDADLPRGVVGLLRSSGFDAIDVRDQGMGSAPDSVIADFAVREGRAIMTGDGDFADIRNYPPHEYHGIVVIAITSSDTRDVILSMIAAFLSQSFLMGQLAGRLVVVEPGRVRLRPPLQG